jgi:mono/diheme cytochrome c family protein
MRRARPLALAAACAVLGACEARPPSSLETAIATRVKRAVTVGGRGDANPLPDTPEVAARGREDFGHYCAACHGLDGQATGVPFATAMSPPVPSLASPEVQAYQDGQLHRIIERGLSPSGMPAARGILNDEEVWEIVRWLRHLPPAGSLGEPPFYGADPPPPGTAAAAAGAPARSSAR